MKSICRIKRCLIFILLYFISGDSWKYSGRPLSVKDFHHTVNEYRGISQTVRHKYNHDHSLKALIDDIKSDDLVSIQSAAQGSTEESNSTISLNFGQIKPFLDIAIPYFKENSEPRNLLIQVLALTLANSGISVLFSFIGRDFYNALNARDEQAFYTQILEFFSAIVLAVPVSVYYRFIREKLSLTWREGLTKEVLEKYYSNKTFFILETLKDIDNPDQRIADDIRAFTRTSLDFLITVCTALIDLLSFSAILFQIYPALFGAIIVYAAAGSYVTSRIGSSLVSLNYDRLQKEANFRFNLIRTRENAESIAFYDPNATIEKQGLWKLFEAVYTNQLDLIFTQRNLEGFTTAYRYLPNILPSLIVAPLYFAHKVELGSISQSYGAFNHVLGDFSILINQFESLSAFAAGLTRLSTFLKRIDVNPPADIETNASQANKTVNSMKSGWDSMQHDSESIERTFVQMRVVHETMPDENKLHKPILRVENLTITTPDRSRLLIGGDIAIDGDHTVERGEMSQKGISLEIIEGDRVLIVGPSGAGKSSFLRAISGLWEVGDGRVTWNIRRPIETADSVKDSSLERLTCSDVMFIPQKPYNFLGSLRDQILYPYLDEMNTDPSSIGHAMSLPNGNDSIALGHIPSNDKFYKILQSVKLGELASRIGKGDPALGLTGINLDWSNVLSLGEQQRLAFARVLYHRPSVVVLDEATSALDIDSEKVMYELLGRKGLNATVISVGHRPSLLAYHTKRLILQGAQCNAKLMDITDETATLLD